MQTIAAERVKEIINNCSGKTIAVVGDVMLDRYYWGSVSRVSPEAPVPVVDIENETIHLGGAANVAHNLKSLGIDAVLCGIIGDDYYGNVFREISNENGISTMGLFTDTKRPTTVKTRIIGNNQQIARLDHESTASIGSQGIAFIKEVLEKQANLAGIIFQDYNKGALVPELILQITEFAVSKDIPLFVDPKFHNFFAFQNATVFKPNKKEATGALNITLKNHDEIVRAGRTLLEKLNCKNVLLTLGADGMMLFESNGEISSVPTRARRVSDVSGAGDTAIATLAAMFAGLANVSEAASVANFASGVVCEEPGIVSITVEKLLKAIRNYIENNGTN